MKMYKCDACGVEVPDNARWKNGTEFRHVSQGSNPCGGKWKEVQEQKQNQSPLKQKAPFTPVYAMDIAQECFISKYPTLLEFNKAENQEEAIRSLLMKVPVLLEHYARGLFLYPGQLTEKNIDKILEPIESQVLNIIKSVNAHLKNHYKQSILDNDKLDGYIRSKFSEIRLETLNKKNERAQKEIK